MHTRQFGLIFAFTFLAFSTFAASPVWWGQWGQNQLHQGSVSVTGQTGSRILADIVYDPFVDKEQVGAYASGDLLVHYQTPLIDGNDVFMEFKTGQFTNIQHWEVQTWGERKYSWVRGQLVQQWEITSDWKPTPFSKDKDGPGWEPVYHGVLTSGALYVPGFGGTIWKIDRSSGAVLANINPFASVDPNTYTVGPLSADKSGNVYYRPAAGRAAERGQNGQCLLQRHAARRHCEGSMGGRCPQFVARESNGERWRDRGPVVDARPRRAGSHRSLFLALFDDRPAVAGSQRRRNARASDQPRVRIAAAARQYRAGDRHRWHDLRHQSRIE